MSARSDERRIRQLVAPRLSPDERFAGCCRAWVSKATRLRSVTELRRRFVVVTTNQRLMLFSTSFWSRRPRRRVFTRRLDELAVIDIGSTPLRRLELPRENEPPLVVDLGSDDRCRSVALSLLIPPDDLAQGGGKAAELPVDHDSERDEPTREDASESP